MLFSPKATTPSSSSSFSSSTSSVRLVLSQILPVVITMMVMLMVMVDVSDSCMTDRLKRRVRKPYNRPKITRGGKCVDITTTTTTTTSIDRNHHTNSNSNSDSNVLIPGVCNPLPYNQTYFPNSLRHPDINTAGPEAQMFHPLTKIKCSPYFQSFLCSVFYPQCSPAGEEMILPCRSFCEKAHDGCADLMNKYGFSWPAAMRCDLYPSTSCDEGHSVMIESFTRRRETEDGGEEDRKRKMKEQEEEEEEMKKKKKEEEEKKKEEEEEKENSTVVKDPDSPTPCVRGSYNCRHSKTKLFLNQEMACCFDGKEINVRTSCSNTPSRGTHGTADCTCVYTQPPVC